MLLSVKKETNALCIFIRIPSMFKQQTNKVFNNVFLACGWPDAVLDPVHTCRHGHYYTSVHAGMETEPHTVYTVCLLQTFTWIHTCVCIV